MLNRKPVVLLIEDDENVNAANRQLLEREGYAVRVARGVAEARRQRGAPADMAILDLDLPDGDGLLLLPELCALAGGVLVLSGNKGAAARALEHGARGFIAKPYRLDELCRKVKGLVGPGDGAADPSRPTPPRAAAAGKRGERERTKWIRKRVPPF